MGVYGMSEEEKKKISEQHKKLEKEAKEKKDLLKQGLVKPKHSKKTP